MTIVLQDLASAVTRKMNQNEVLTNYITDPKSFDGEIYEEKTLLN